MYYFMHIYHINNKCKRLQRLNYLCKNISHLCSCIFTGNCLTPVGQLAPSFCCSQRSTSDKQNIAHDVPILLSLHHMLVRVVDEGLRESSNNRKVTCHAAWLISHSWIEDKQTTKILPFYLDSWSITRCQRTS